MLVGADGIASRVRQLAVPEFKLADTEGRLIFGKTAMAEVPLVSAGLLDELTLVRGAKIMCLLEKMTFTHSENESSSAAAADYIYWVLFLRKDQIMPDANLLRLDTRQKAELVRKLTSDWHTDLAAVLSSPGASASVMRVATMNPSSLPSKNNQSQRVVLIGDAAHAMAPTAASGATSALHDTAVFIKHFVSNGSITPDISEANKAYVDETTAYAQVAMAKTLFGGRAVFGMKDYDQLPLIN